jgi:membrane fusion protein (multidrug efflux system)
MSADGSNKVVEMKATETPSRPAAPPEAPAKAAKAPNRRRRLLLMAIVPVLLVLAGAYFWLTGGRYISTDNAYVQQDKVTLTGSVAGRIVEVAVGENDRVKAGDLLFRIDPEPYRIALAEADASLASARLQVEQYRAAYQEALAAVKAATQANDYAQKSLQRQEDLLGKGVTTAAAFDQAQSTAETAAQTLAQVQQKVISARAALGGDPDIATDHHPLVMAALAARDQAALNLRYTDVFAPADGTVVQAGSAQVGQYVSSPAAMPTPVLGLVEDKNVWVEANFKETELTNIKVGDSATVKVDLYPGETFNAVVESIGAGTGSEFSLLPAQNATGNWVKVVQRVPVRLRFTGDPGPYVMRAGLSASVKVDTKTMGSKVGMIAMPANAADKP